MNRKHYLLPADFCKDALARYQIAKDDAIAAKHDLMAKYHCTAILRRGRFGEGLIFDTLCDLSGFTVPRKLGEHWLAKPKKNTITGKVAARELDDCCHLLEIWQWALEHALGVYGCVLDRDGFHYLVAKPLKDGRVVLDVPAGKNRQRGPNVSRNFDDPVIPECAQPITEAEAKLRVIYDGLEQEHA